MKRIELEQRIKEINFRLSKLTERMQKLEDDFHSIQCQLDINKVISQNIDRIDKLEKKISAFSDELYLYIDDQQQKMKQYIEETGMDLEKRVQCLSDNIYEHVGRRIDETDHDLGSRIQRLSDDIYEYVGNQLQIRDRKSEQVDQQQRKNDWMVHFGYDNMISELQLSQIESVVPGNRRRLLELKDTHVGETCFVIGNGPSLKAGDLDMLNQKGIFCFASKGIYKIFDETQWRPNVWGVSDLDYIEIKKDDINRLNGFIKLVCAQSYIQRGILLRDVIYYPFIQAKRTPKFFNQDVARGVHFYGMITGKLINFAVYMGFTEIYLLGCDTTFPLRVDENGKKTVDTNKRLHFSASYYENKEEERAAYRNIMDMEQEVQYTIEAYKDIKYFCDQIGVQIYNATRGGELEVFPRVHMDQQFVHSLQD